MVNIAIVSLPHAEDLPLPAYATEDSAGMDLLAAIEQEIVIPPQKCALIPAGISIALPKGYEAQVRPRSGLALKHGITVLNSPGTIDADYRGEIGVILINHSDTSYTVIRGTRIAQLIIAPYVRAEWQQKETLEESARGTGGFGSTGIDVKKSA
jgi:dUTP pyrophosphatase